MNSAGAEQQESSRSLYRRLRFTPLSDLVRGKLSERLNHRMCVDTSPLPDELKRLISEVVRLSKLRRSEKADVAQELVDHFVAGRHAGMSAERLAAEFGNAHRAAKLIRRAKKRNRSVVYRTWIRGLQATGLVIVLLMVLVIGWQIRFRMGSPAIARNYVAEFNAPARALPADQRAWPKYRSVALSMSPWTFEEPDESEAERLARIDVYLDEHREQIETIRSLAAMPHLGYLLSAEPDREIHEWGSRGAEQVPEPAGKPASGSVPLVAVTIDYIRPMLHFVRVLRHDGDRALREGDGARLVENIAAIIGIAEQFHDQPFAITSLMSISTFNEACKLICESLATRPDALDDSELRQLAHLITSYQGGAPIRVELRTERSLFDDLVQRVYTDDGSGDGHLSAEGIRQLSDLISAMWGASGGQSYPEMGATLAGMFIAERRAMTEEFDRLWMLMRLDQELPMWRWDERRLPEEYERISRSTLWRLRYIMIDNLMPAFSRLSERAELTTIQRDATGAAIALTLHQRRHGVFPTTLEELVPGLLPSVPVDRFDGQPLRYTLDQGRAGLYSIGGDLDDDGGRPVLDAEGDPMPEQAGQWLEPGEREPRGRGLPRIDGDWVIWTSPSSSAD